LRYHCKRGRTGKRRETEEDAGTSSLIQTETEQFVAPRNLPPLQAFMRRRSQSMSFKIAACRKSAQQIIYMSDTGRMRALDVRMRKTLLIELIRLSPLGPRSFIP
jgi:hypothetical protein